jgi:hypothetical protein
MLRGSCYCGDICYEVTGIPFQETNCHCSICRRTTGAPYVSWFSVPRDSFKFISGQPRQFRSMQKGIRSFCSRCGTQLTFEQNDLDEIDVTICSLEDPQAFPPRDHTYTSSMLAWVKLSDGLMQYKENRKG